MPRVTKVEPKAPVVKRGRGRPKGTKNKVKESNGFRYDPNKEYQYWFIADACGCRIGADVIGSGMWCKHKNSMHLENRKQYSDYKG